MAKFVMIILFAVFATFLVSGQKGGYKVDRYVAQQQYPLYPMKQSPYIVQSPISQYRYLYEPPYSPIERRRAQVLLRNSGAYDDYGKTSQYNLANYEEYPYYA